MSDDETKKSSDENGEEVEEEERPTSIGIEGNEIPLQSLSPQQLAQLTQQLKVETQALANSIKQFQVAGDRLRASQECVEVLGKHSEGVERKGMLVPLSSSVYVDGIVDKPDKILVDIGAGYFCEKSVKSTIGFLESKVEGLQKSATDVANHMKRKQAVWEEANSMLQKYQQQMQPQEGA